MKKKYNRVTKMKFIVDVTVAYAETNGAVDLDADSIAELIDFHLSNAGPFSVREVPAVFLVCSVSPNKRTVSKPRPGG